MRTSKSLFATASSFYCAHIGTIKGNLYVACGRGTNNFLPPWDSDSYYTDSSTTKYDLLHIPYSHSIHEYAWDYLKNKDKQLPEALTVDEVRFLDEHLGNLWRLPQDRRMCFCFQEYDLRLIKTGINYWLRQNPKSIRDVVTPIAAKLRLLEQLGGRFEVTDSDDCAAPIFPRRWHGGFTYCRKKLFSPICAEELELNISPITARKTCLAVPPANWHRLMCTLS